MDKVKSVIRGALGFAGLQLRRIPKLDDVDRAIATLVEQDSQPLILDVGANEGQSVHRFKRLFPECELHAFEPSPSTFQKLKLNTLNFANVVYNQAGVGSKTGILSLRENEYSDMSSFLEPSESCWGNIVNTTRVPVVTLDSYCESKKINEISILKTDTQGFDYEVLVGATNLIQFSRVHIVLTEMIFSDMYKNSKPFGEYYSFLKESGYKLVGFYGFGRQDGLASWCDGLFVNPDFAPKLSRSMAS